MLQKRTIRTAALLASLFAVSSAPAVAAEHLTISRGETAILKAENAYWDRHGKGIPIHLTITSCDRHDARNISCSLRLTGPFEEHQALILTDTATLHSSSRVSVRFASVRLT